jgi:ribosome recycling factor
MFDITTYTSRFEAALNHLAEELKKVRTGRAHPDMLGSVMVDAYGAKMPLNQVASVSVPEPQQLLITPFDPTNIQAIATAIRNDQSLGLNPTDDGHNVRISIPPLTEDRRRDIVRSLGEKAENARINLRNIREEARKAAKLQKEAKTFGDDELKRIEKSIDEAVAKFNSQIDETLQSKETEIMTI